MATFFKVVVLGDGGIGKTSICNYLTTGEFFGSYKLSIGADFFSKKLNVDGEEIALQICDIGGQDQFAEISNIFTKGAHGAILCYDTTRRDTLDSLDRWLTKLEDPNIPKVLVSTKNDVEDLREVLDEEGLETAKRLDIPYYIPTTSLKGIGITETFESISRLMLLNKKEMDAPLTSMVDVTQDKQDEVFPVSSSQHISAQPLGIGRVPTGNNDDITPPTAPLAPNIEPVQEFQPPVVEPTEAEPSFTKPISLAPPIVTTETMKQPTEEIIKPIIGSEEESVVEPPTEPEKTATQPISTITPPISEQEKEPESTQTDNSGSFTFLQKLKEERKRLEEESDE